MFCLFIQSEDRLFLRTFLYVVWWFLVVYLYSLRSPYQLRNTYVYMRLNQSFSKRVNKGSIDMRIMSKVHVGGENTLWNCLVGRGFNLFVDGTEADENFSNGVSMALRLLEATLKYGAA